MKDARGGETLILGGKERLLWFPARAIKLLGVKFGTQDMAKIFKRLEKQTIEDICTFLWAGLRCGGDEKLTVDDVLDFDLAELQDALAVMTRVIAASVPSAPRAKNGAQKKKAVGKARQKPSRSRGTRS